MAVIDGSYLSKEGLTYLWGKLKTILANKLELKDVWGLGTSIPKTANLNDDTYKTAGVYYRQGNAQTDPYVGNIPVQTHWFRLIVEYINTTGRIRQTFISQAVSGTYYTRVYNAGGWQPWRTFVSFEGVLEAGTELTASANNTLDIHSVTTCGRYFFMSSSAAHMTSLPVSGIGGELIVEQVQGANRVRQTFYPVYPSAGASSPGEFYVSFLYSGTISSNPTWPPWYKFEGTAVT